jgi:uncharacterized small protein (DUF1192 family)
MATRRTPDSAPDTDAASPQALWQAGFDAMTQAANQALGPLEGLFGQRVAKAMSQMGMPAPLEVLALREQVQALQDRVDRLEAALAAAPAAKKSATVAKKAPATASRSRQPRS